VRYIYLTRKKEHGAEIIAFDRFWRCGREIKVTGFSDWDSMFYNNLLSIPVLVIFLLRIEDWDLTV